jgi:SAM-dependent methyltransferase
VKEGFLGYQYLEIAGALDSWGWWPNDLSGKTVADVGCFTGGLSMLMAARGADTVYAVDEMHDHLAQCRYMAELFQMRAVTPIASSAYHLDAQLAPASLDLMLLSGVLYHMSDMLVGLYGLGQRIKPGGTLLIETNAVDDFTRSYANFGRFYAGMWWQPTARCVQDMCEFMGFEDVEVRFYKLGRCLVRARRAAGDIAFKRGMNWRFADLRDAERRTMDDRIMAPARLALRDRVRMVRTRLASFLR